MAIKDWSTTAALNTVEFPEGMTAGTVNDSARTIQADVRTWYETSEWVELGYTHVRVSSTELQISDADYTATYHAGRRIKVYSSTDGTIYYTILSVLFNSVDTVATLDAATLSTDIDNVWIAASAEDNPSVPWYSNTDETLATVGFSSETAPVFNCVRMHDRVTISHESGDYFGTSDATGFTVGTLPAIYRPSGIRGFSCQVEDNGVWTWGMARVGTDGVITFFNNSSLNFTASGTKAFQFYLTMTYPI